MRPAVTEMRARLDRAQALQRGGRGLRLERRGGLGTGNQRHRATVAGGGLDLVGRRAQAVAPVVGSDDTVVEDEEQRVAPRRSADAAGIPHRPGHREDEAGGGENP